VDAGGRRSSGGQAFVPVLGAVPRLAPLARLARRVPVPLLDLGYRFVARHRAGFGRLVPQRAKRSARQMLVERGGSPAQGGGSCGLPALG
jgi:predicted DCC family thiol-disulfide oxidoreductase YuxK